MAQQKQGFTIIEIIVVIAVIGTLLSIVFVSMSSFRSRSNKATAVGAAEQVKLNLSTYFQNRNRYPASQADVVNYLNSKNESDLATKFSKATTYNYQATMADGSTCTMTGATTCDKYVITVYKTVWNGPASDNDVLITP
ncbi:MAG: prepilin-type N-terminal cleavage/methylation domain-containing protein [Candidatus Saccharimonadales bacterium]